MKERILIIAIVIMAVFSVSIHAEDLNIVESPNVKIVIDGVIGGYDDVPLIVNSRTMLPLRAVLTNLGIPNDDDHIIWNPDERSVTIKTADSLTSIWLQIDNYTAKVNGSDVTIDVAPMIYPKNNRSYIPARFVSEALGKKVAWDGSTTAVLITDIERYEAIKEVMEKSTEAMEGADNLAMDLKSTITTKGQEDFSMDLLLSVIENPQQPASYIKLGVDLDMESLGGGEVTDEDIQGMLALTAFLNMEIYEMEDYTYSKTFLSGDGWLKSETTAEESISDSDSISISQDTMMLGTEDTVLAGLTLKEDTEEGTTILEGTVYIEEMAEQSMSFNTADFENSEVEEYYVVYTLDSETYEIVSLEVNMHINSVDENGEDITVISSTKVTMNILDEGYEITVPDEVLNNIVEPSFFFGF